MSAAGRDGAAFVGHRPHDLLWLADASALRAEGAMPAWATPEWLAVAPVVVRRALPRLVDHVPVGLRGATRSERCAAEVPAGQIDRAATPEAIAHRALTLPIVGTSPLPCLHALRRLAPALDELSIGWGVTGGVGFTLATGYDVLRPDSDLDLLVRASAGTDAGTLRRIGRLLAATPSRVDVQVETESGAFALAEWLRTGGPVLLKTSRGPLLVDDPWAATAAPAASEAG